MKTNDVEKVLEEFTNDDSGKSILIDGPWGCGKTYNVLKYIEKQKKQGKKIVYLSLFGYKSIESINKALYEMTRAIESFFVNSIKIIPSLLSMVPYVNDVVKGLDFQLDIKGSGKVKDRSIIIFDDLERLPLTIDYIELFGYINTLFACGCRVMCLVSSNNILDNSSTRKATFNEFKEKVFDRYYIINKTNCEIYDSLFDGERYAHIKASYGLFDNNIRLARKTKLFLDEVYGRIVSQKRSLEDCPYDSLLLNTAILYTVIIVFGKSKEPVLDDENRGYYAHLQRKYGENLANNYYFLMNKDECKDNFDVKGFNKLLKSLIDAFIYRNYGEFDSIMFTERDEKVSSILDKSYFFLTDKGKEEYRKTFIKYLEENKIEWDRKGRSIISVLFNDGFPFDDKTIKLLSKLIIKSGVEETPNFLWEFGIVGRTSLNDEEKHFIDELTIEVSNCLANKYIKDYEEIYSKNDYQKLMTCLEKIGFATTPEKESFKENFIKKHFYLPDLSVEINKDVWSYSRSVAQFVEMNQLDENFIKHAISTCSNNKDNHSLIERYRALIFYSLHNEDIDNDVLVGKKPYCKKQ